VALAKEFQIDDKSVRAGATTGISVFPHNGSDAPHCWPMPRGAVPGEAKSRGSISVFEPEMDSRSAIAACCTRISRSRSGTANCRCTTSRSYLGPDVATSEVIGFEALARWMHPVRGFVSPGDFIPLAEESGLIVEMGEWILREACREAASWPVPLQIAVNFRRRSSCMATWSAWCIRSCSKPGWRQIART